MIYELRQYTIDRGRIADNHERMRVHNPPLLERHGIDVVGRWSVLAGPVTPMFCYLMEWRDFTQREAAWASFYADPDWAKVRTGTNGGFEMVEANDTSFLRPNPIFAGSSDPLRPVLGGVHQLLLHRTAIGQTAAVNAFLRDLWLPRAVAAGAAVIGVLDAVSGPAMPVTATLLAWPDETAWRDGWRRFENDGELAAEWNRQRRELGRTLLGPATTLLLEPADYALPVAMLRGASPA